MQLARRRFLRLDGYIWILIVDQISYTWRLYRVRQFGMKCTLFFSSLLAWGIGLPAHQVNRLPLLAYPLLLTEEADVLLWGLSDDSGLVDLRTAHSGNLMLNILRNRERDFVDRRLRTMHAAR